MCVFCNGVSRRAFLGTGGVLSTGLLMGSQSSTGAAMSVASDEWERQPPIRVYVVYLGTGGAWPKPEFDAPAEMSSAMT